MLSTDWDLIPLDVATDILSGRSDVLVAVDQSMSVLVKLICAEVAEFGDELGLSQAIGLRLANVDAVVVRSRIDAPVVLTQVISGADQRGVAAVERLVAELNLAAKIVWRNEEAAHWPMAR